VLAELDEVPGLSRAVARQIRTDPTAAIARLADTLQAYWDLALADHWPRIHALLEADVQWRARRLTTGGATALFEDLHETITWHGHRLTAADPHDYSGALSGDGLLLVPAVMTWPNVRKLIEPYQATLLYPVRGILTLWETGAPPAADALAALIGRTRAALLTNLGQPASTTHLAHRLSLTPGAISQHLSVLHDCGLVTRSRVGPHVLYRRTPNGDMLLTAEQSATG
jgi:DNA-binding transcriptional ArsR family regulator